MASITQQLVDGQREIKQCLDEINITLVRHDEILKQHLFRTDLAEKRIEKLEKDMEPTRDHIRKMDGAVKLVALVSLLATIAGVVFKYIL